jgi:hypothetical protein
MEYERKVRITNEVGDPVGWGIETKEIVNGFEITRTPLTLCTTKTTTKYIGGNMGCKKKGKGRKGKR